MSTRPVAWVKLEEDAYYAVLRALAVNELNWEKEKLLTDLRSILHITNDQHFKFLEEVMSDKLVTKLRNSAKNGDAGMSQAANANTMPPPPPRQHTPAQAQNPRKNRPNSAGPKFPPGNSPAPLRPHRLSDTTGAGRSRSSKRPDSPDLKRRSSSLKAGRGIQSQRNRGRGRRIVAIPREQPSLQVVQQRTKRKMHSTEYIRKVMEAGVASPEAYTLQAELEAQSNLLLHHMSVIDQLNDENLAESDPAKFCRLCIEELEMATEDIDAEDSLLQSSDEEATQA